MNRLEQMLQAIPETYDKSIGGFAYDLLAATSLEVDALEQKVAAIVNKFDVEQLNGAELTRFVLQRTGLKRKVATYATTSVTFAGTAGITVAKGTAVAASDIVYITTDDCVIAANGSVTANVQCSVAGAIGNVPTGAITSFPVTVAGVTTVTNPQAVSNGFDEEDDKALRDRYYDKLQRPGKAGNKFHYEEWAKEVTGVGKVKVFPRWNGPLTVKVVLVDANGGVPGADVLARTSSYIATQQPFGANVTVESATLLNISVTATFTLASGYLLSDVLVKVRNKLNVFMKTITFEPGVTYVSLAQVGREILAVDGVLDYSNLKLNGVSANVAIGDTQIPFVNAVVSA